MMEHEDFNAVTPVPPLTYDIPTPAEEREIFKTKKREHPLYKHILKEMERIWPTIEMTYGFHWDINRKYRCCIKVPSQYMINHERDIFNIILREVFESRGYKCANFKEEDISLFKHAFGVSSFAGLFNLDDLVVSIQFWFEKF